MSCGASLSLTKNYKRKKHPHTEKRVQFIRVETDKDKTYTVLILMISEEVDTTICLDVSLIVFPRIVEVFSVDYEIFITSNRNQTIQS